MKQFDRKVIKVGNSYGVAIPAQLLKEADLAYGDDIQVEVKDGNIVLSKKEHIELPEGVDAEFMNVLNDVIKDHDKAFKGLVDNGH